MNVEYVVYRHVCPNGKCYVGITGRSVESRWNFGHGYDTQLFGRAVKKYGWENITHEILEENLTLAEANEREKYFIKKFQSNNPIYGYNCTDGGGGTCGRKISEEERERMRKSSLRMWENPEIREKLLKHLAEISAKNVGVKRSEEAIQKTKQASSIAVDKYTKDGDFVQTYPSLMDAAIDCGAKSNSLIVSCCKKSKKHKTAYGFIWRYNGDLLTEEDIKLANTRNLYNTRRVVALTVEGEIVNAYSSVHEAGRAVGADYRQIHNCCSGIRKTAKGYYWQFVD